MRTRKVWMFLAFWLLVGTSIGDAQDQQAKSELTVTLPVVDGKYDIRPLYSEAISNRYSAHDVVWFPLSARTRVGLALLQANGVLSRFDITHDEINLSFETTNKRFIRSVLNCPRIHNLENLQMQSRLVLFIHGLEGGKSTFAQMFPAFEDAGWFPLVMTYANDGPVEIPSKFLAEALNRIHEQNPDSRIVVVAHSLGGILSWSSLTESNTSSVTDFFTIGVPFSGSALACFQNELEVYDSIVGMLSGNLDSLDTYSDGSGEAIEILLADSSIRKAILSKPLPKNVRLHVIAGTRGPIPLANRDSLIREVDRWISSKKPSDEFAMNLRVLASSDEIVAGLGDGAVSLKSAKSVKGYQTYKQFDRSHIELLKNSGENDEVVQYILSVLK